MRAYDVIYKKRNGQKLSQDEISFMVEGYNKHEIADYQMSAFLMSVYFQNLDDQETFHLTSAMAKSGEILDLKFLDGPTADKHSTGGVGDGTSLLIAPILASCDIYVPMMSGRALGHTGGTLDKLESIPGFNVNLDIKEFISVLKDEFADDVRDIPFLKNDLFYINFFSIVRDMSILDWKIWLIDFDDINPKTVKLKMLYTMRRLNKPIHYQELPAKIMEWFPYSKVKVNTVHNDLVKHNDVFVNLWLGLYGLKEWGYEGWSVRDILIRVFKKFDRPMNTKELSKEVLKQKMVSQNTVLLNLQKYKKDFKRIDKGLYQYTGK